MGSMVASHEATIQDVTSRLDKASSELRTLMHSHSTLLARHEAAESSLKEKESAGTVACVLVA